MALVLTLQLLMLLFATTGFAAPSPGCPSSSLINDSPVFENFKLSNAFLGVGQLSYDCTGSGSFDFIDLETELFDATCVDGSLEDVVNATVAYIQGNPDVITLTSQLNVYIEEKYDFNSAGKLKSINSTSLEIDVNGDGDTSVQASVVVSTTDNYQGDSQGKQLANKDGSTLIDLEFSVTETDGLTPSTCTPGYAGSNNVVFIAYLYGAQD